MDKSAAGPQDAHGAVAAWKGDLARRNKELAALVEATKAIASSLDLGKILEAIVCHAASISGTPIVRLLLVDETGRELRYRIGMGLPLEVERGLVIPVGESFSGQVAASGQPLAVADCREDPRLRYPEHATKYSLISYLGLPVKLGGRVLGVLVFNTKAPRVYSAEEITYLSAFADQAAIALENARLYEAARRELAERTQAEEALAVRTRHLEAIRSISEEITRELDLKAVLDLIIHRAVALVGATSGSIRLWNQEQQLLIPVAQIGSGTHSAGVPLRLGEGAAGAAAEQRRGLIVNDFRTSAYTIPALLKGTTHTAVMATPLLYGERLVGAVGITRDETDPPFSEADLEIVNLFASQAAIAIENARLYETTLRHAQMLATLNDLSRALAMELDPQRLAQQILASTQALIPGAAGRLWRRTEEGDVLHVVASLGLGDPEGGLTLSLRSEEGLPGIAAATRRPVISQDVTQDPRFLNKPWAADEGLVACLVLPLIYGEHVSGALAIYTRAPHTFTDEQVGVLSAFAAQAAIALEKARLFDTVQQVARETRSLYEVAHTLVTSLDPIELLDLISVKTTELLGTPHAQVVLWDEDTKILRLGAAHGTQAEQVKQQQFRLGDGVNGVVAQTRVPLIVNDYQAFPKRVPGMTELVAVIGVPLLYRGRLLGILSSHATKPGWRFTENHLALLTSFADQAAIAIENARLYDTIRHHAAELEVRVRQRTAELEEALRVKVEFLGKMSHELRTPLNFVLGFSDLLQQGIGGALTPKQATYVDRIQSGGRRLLSLFNNVLDMAQVDTGKSRLHLEPVILGSLLQEVLGLLQIQAAQKRLKVSTVLDPWLPFVVADRFKLAQILHNLIGNAVKFTPDGGSIRVTARQVPGSESTGAGERRGRGAEVQGSGGAVEVSPQPPGATAPQQFVEISVEDTGIGIRPEHLEAIFAAFHQVDGSDSRAYEGAGLGLTLVRMLVELHGGRLWAESAGPGQGARFVVRLPRLEVPKAKRILLVEDEAVVRLPMASTLESAGFVVEQAATGTGALAAMDAGAPDLLILDILLPDLDGWEILRRVREADDIRTLPVLVVTGLESVSAEQAFARGADEFLTKPVSPRVLVDTVVRLLAHFAGGGAALGQRAGEAEEERDRGIKG